MTGSTAWCEVLEQRRSGGIPFDNERDPCGWRRFAMAELARDMARTQEPPRAERVRMRANQIAAGIRHEPRVILRDRMR